MNRLKSRKFFIGIIVGALLISSFALALANISKSDRNINYSNIKVYLEDKPVDLTDSNGTNLKPLIIDETAYIPLRLFSEQLGLEVEWDDRADSIYLRQPGRDDKQETSMENLLFLGDSLFYNPEEVSHTFSEHGHQVFAAIGATLPQFYGLTDQEVTIGMKDHYIKGTLSGREYNGIVILMGANDLANYDENAVFVQYMELLQEIQSVNSVPVYVLQVFPVNRNYSRRYGDDQEKNRRAEALNDILRRYCENEDGLFYADATKGFVDEDGQFLHDYGDGLHMDPEYYGMLYDNIMEAISAPEGDN